jgi:hypothetical protein
MARTPRMIGAFHGAMPRITPTGSFSAMARQPGLSDGMTSPGDLGGQRSRFTHHASGKPEVEHRPAGGRADFAHHRGEQRHRPYALPAHLAAFISTARRAFGPIAAQAGNAAAALAATAGMSPAFIAVAEEATSPVIGFLRLEARSLIQRQKVDGRSHGLFLTEEGSELLGKAKAVIDHHDRELAARLPEGSRVMFLDALNALWRA